MLMMMTDSCLHFQSHLRYPYPDPEFTSLPPSNIKSMTGDDGVISNRLSQPNCKCQTQEKSTRTRGICRINKSAHVIPSVFLVLLLSSCLGLLPGCVSGLSCFECLSLECYSGAICQSIKESFLQTFVRNSHYIHFDPRILCPGPDVPRNSSDWDRVLFNCSRSDSVCLEAPIYAITSFNGFKDGKKVERPSYMKSWGYLRGCASRRGLKELPYNTISMRKVPTENDTLDEDTMNINNNNIDNDNSQSTSYNNNNNKKNNNNNKNHSPRYKNIKYKDGYKIQEIHYHEIYVEHAGVNSTKCYIDACNNKRRLKVRSTSTSLHLLPKKSYYVLYLFSLYLYSFYFYIFL